MKEEQKKIIQKLEVIQQGIVMAEDPSLADLTAQFAIDNFRDQVMDVFSEGSLLIHSLSSFITKRKTEKEVSEHIFGELLHIDRIKNLGYRRTSHEDNRTLYLAVDADYIGAPPEEEAEFDIFMERVKVPIDSLAEIKVAS